MDNAQDTWQKALCDQQLGTYRTVSYLGGGAFSYVYQAERIGSADLVALKVLVPGSSPDATSEFATEGELLARLQQASGVITLLETGQDTAQITWGGSLLPLPINFHAMELASGCLEELLAERAQVDWLERLRLWRGVILGVHQMHIKSMAHRDLKSENCLLFVGPRQRTDCRVADLGRSRDLRRPARYDRVDYLAGRGDLRFAPPEYLWCQGEDNANAHKAADIYGLGSVLFEVATGLGMTQMALGSGPDLVHANLKAGVAGQVIDLSVLRPRYETPLDVFAAEVPAVIRREAMHLLEQICNPDPDLRWPRVRGRGVARGDGLEWLIRQADILIRRLEASRRDGRGPKRRRAVS